MKSCPTCRRTFEDTFSFCLVDGAILSAPFDPEATKVRPGSSGDVQTEVLSFNETLAHDVVTVPTGRPSTQPILPSSEPPTLVAQPEPKSHVGSPAPPVAVKNGPNRWAQWSLGLVPATVGFLLIGPRYLPASLIASYLAVILAVVIPRKVFGLPAAIIGGYFAGAIVYQLGFLGSYVPRALFFYCVALAGGSWAATRLIGLVLRVARQKR